MKKFKHELRWAVNVALFVAVWMMMEKAWGWHGYEMMAKQPLFNYLMYLPIFGIYYFAVRDKRKRIFEGRISWREAFTSALVMGFIAAMLMPLVQFAVYEFISPQLFANKIEFALKERSFSEEQANALGSLNAAMLQSIAETVGLAAIYGAIVASMLKTE